MSVRQANAVTRQIAARRFARGRLALGGVVLCLAVCLLSARPVAASTGFINVTVVGSGTVSDGSHSCTSSCTFSYDTTIGSLITTVTATPGSEFYLFASWTGCSPAKFAAFNTCQIVVGAGTTTSITATFHQGTAIEVTFANSPASGSLSAYLSSAHTTSTICTSTCIITVDTSSGSFPEVLTATPNTGAQFLYWQSGSSGAQPVCSSNQCSFTASPGLLVTVTVTFIFSGGPGITGVSTVFRVPTTLVLTGVNFLSSSVVSYNGSALATTFVSSTQLWADFPSGLAIAKSVQVSNSGTLSNLLPVPFAILSGTPLTISSVSPNTVAAGSQQFTLTANLSTAPPAGAYIYWNTSGRAAALAGPQAVSATIAASEIAPSAFGSFPTFVKVRIGDSTGPSTSAALFQVTAPPLPTPNVLSKTGTLVTNTTNNPTSSTDPAQGCGTGSKSKPAWFEYVPPVSGTIKVDTGGSSYVPLMSYFAGSPTGTALGCSAGSITSAIGPRPTTTIVPATLSFSATAGTAYWFFVTAANGDGGTLDFNLNFVANSVNPGLARFTSLPQVVRGGGYVTKLTVTNMTQANNNVVLNYVAPDGTLAETQTTQLAPAGTARIATTPQPNATLQWATIGSDAAITANLFFEFSDGNGNVVNTVGFNDAPPLTSFVIPVEFETAVGRTVGLALANPSSSAASITLKLVNGAGATVATSGAIPLAGFAKASFDLASGSSDPTIDAALAPIKSAITALGSANFIGTLTGTSTVAVDVLGVGDDKGPFYSTPPLPAGGTRLIIPHMVIGGGFLTKLTFVDLSGAPNTATVTYYDQSGHVLSTTGLPGSVPLAANGAARIAPPESARSAGAQILWAVVTSTGPLAANLFFEFANGSAVVNTIGFNHVPELTSFTFPVEFEQSSGSFSRTAGLALANAGASTASVTLTLVDGGGNVLATSPVSLATLNQTSLTLSTITAFQNVLPAGNFVGSVTVTSNVPIVGLALEADRGPFSAVPPVAGTPQ